jgi:hypothetical protein
MTRRKGEITRSTLKRKWPHHVALPADKVRGLANSELVHSVAASLSAERTSFLPSRAVRTLEFTSDYGCLRLLAHHGLQHLDILLGPWPRLLLC